MPTYDFKCSDCGLVFDKFVRDRDTSSFTCLDCGSEASRSEVSPINFVFGNGKVVGNTGVDSLDSSIDKAVGRDAEKRWEAVKDRSSRKRSIQRDNGGEGKVPLFKNSNTGEYEPMKSENVSRFQKLHGEYASIYEDHKKKREKNGVSKFRDDDPYVKYSKKSKAKKETDQ